MIILLLLLQGVSKRRKAGVAILQDLFYSLISGTWKWVETHSLSNCLGYRLKEEQFLEQKCRQLDVLLMPLAFMPEQGSSAQARWTQHQRKENAGSSGGLLQTCPMVSLRVPAAGKEEDRMCAKHGGLGQHTAWLNRETSRPMHSNLLERCSGNCSLPLVVWSRDEAGKKVFQLFQGLWYCTLTGSLVFGLNTQLLEMLDYGRNTTFILKSKHILDLCEDLRDSLETPSRLPSRLTPDSHEVKKMCNVLDAALIFWFSLLFFPLVDLGLLVSDPAMTQQWGVSGCYTVSL